MAIAHLNQIDLARRWKISHRTLERWRWAGCGPRYVKIGGRVLYRLEDIEAYEADGLRDPETQTSSLASGSGQQIVRPDHRFPRK
jgi:hypothetical protein